MKIWSTREPRSSDYPIWAYVDDVEDVVLLRSAEDLPPGGKQVTWTKATLYHDCETAFKELVESDHTYMWSSSDWFRAGYARALEDKFSLFYPSITGSNTESDHYSI